MLQTLDFRILDRIQTTFRCRVLDRLMPGISFLGNWGMIWIILAVILLLIKSRRRCGLTLGAGLICGALIGNLLLKNLVARTRPCLINDSVELLIAIPWDSSFPSGHTLSAFVAATILMRYDRRLGVPTLILAVLIAFSRLYLYVHFPSDVLAGALLGVGIGLAVSLVFDRMTVRVRSRNGRQ